MFDIGWQELFIIAVFALIVVGPKDLPNAIRTITSWIRKARSMAREFQTGVNDMVREAELDDVKNHLTRPNDIKKSITDTVDPDGEISKSLVLDEEDEKKLGSVPLNGMSDEDAANMIGVDETGSDKQFEVLNAPEPDDEDVMPVKSAQPAQQAPANGETAPKEKPAAKSAAKKPAAKKKAAPKKAPSQKKAAPKKKAASKSAAKSKGTVDKGDTPSEDKPS